MADGIAVVTAMVLVHVLTSKGSEAAAPLPRPQALIQPSLSDLPTVTVRGFLNFRTTVDGTVIVFTPSSETPQQNQPNEPIAPTKTAQIQISPESTVLKPGTPKDSSLDKTQDFQDLSQANKVFGFEIEPDDVDGTVSSAAPTVPPVSKKTSSTAAIFPVKTTSAPTTPKATTPKTTTPKPTTPKPTTKATTLKPTTKTPPKTTLVTKPTFKGATPKDAKISQSNVPVTRIVETTASSALYPTGLVTVLGGTMISHGATTIHETKVIGTYIQGKYAQILESTSRVIQPSAVGVSPSPTFASQGHSTAPPGLQTIERRGDVGDLEKLLLQASFKSSSATLQSRQIQQTTRLEPKFTETIEDDNKIHFTRRPNGRSQSSTTSRLRYSPLAKSHSVRLNRFKVRLTSRYEDQTALPSEVEHLNAFDSQVKALDLDDPLLNIDPARITWLPTTFTSLVTLRAGQRKSVIRTLTITTSFPTTIEPSEVLSNGISDNAIDPTPSGLVHSRIYSTEQHTWRTSLIPASHDGLTSMQTITESFVIRKFVTAYRTMPSSEITDEMTNETLSFLDESDDSYIKTLLAGDINATATTKTDEPLTSKNILDELQNALQKNPLAALLLGLNTQLQPSLQTVTRSSTYVTTDTLYHTKVVSFYDGRRTRSKRLSDSIGTTERTLTTVTTEVITIQPTQAFPFPFLLQPTPTASYSTITSLYTTVTTGTSYASKIFTLIYNAFSTRYRTVTSSSTYPTTMVITSTSSFLVQPTLAYGGYPSQTSPGYQAQVPQQAQLVHQLSQAVVAEPQPLATVQGNAPQPTPVTTNLPMAMVTKATVFEPVSSAPAILAAGLSSSESVESSIPSADLTSGADEASAVSSSEQVATPVLAIAANLAPAAPPAQAAASSALQPNLTA